MNKKQQLHFIHMCGVLLESGISIREALSIIQKQNQNKKQGSIIQKIQEKVEKGMPLSKSITDSGIKLEPTLAAMITFGENSGTLSASLLRGIDMIETSGNMKRKIIGALVYPTFIGIATLVMTLFLVMYIFPKIMPLFTSMNIRLPFLTRLLLLTYTFLASSWIILLFCLILASAIFVYLYKRKQLFRTKIQCCILVSPAIGKFFQFYHVATFSSSVASLLEVGQSLQNICSQLETGTSNEVYKKIWVDSRSKIEKGIALSECLQIHQKAVPSLAIDLISIGEKTGTLSHMFTQINKIFTDQIDDATKKLGTVLEPFLMIGMGLIVGSVALSIILPIYEITNHLTH